MKTYLVIDKHGNPVQVITYRDLKFMSTIGCFSLALSLILTSMIFTEVKKLTKEEEIVDG